MNLTSIVANIGGLNLQKTSVIIPQNGLLIGAEWSIVFASVTNAAECIAVLMLSEPAAAADIDANINGRRDVLTAIRMRVSAVGAAGVANTSMGRWTPLGQRVFQGQIIWLASNAATNACTATAVIQLGT